jgi:dTMP kinase
VAGLYIALEGPEGSGKSTQLKILADRLRHLGLEVVETREPGGVEVAEAIRSILLDPAHRSITPEAEMLLFAAARAQLVREVVRPALEQGRIVLSDRSVYASLAYQGVARTLGVDVVRRVNEVATGGLLPDLVLVLDLPPEEGLSRARPNRFEGEDPEFHRRVREGFLRLGREDPRVRVVPASGGVQEVASRIWEQVEPLLRARGLLP